jgi:hypothetical protein
LAEQLKIESDVSVPPPKSVTVADVPRAQAEAEHNKQIVCTGKEPRSAGIRDRLHRIQGKS